MFGCLDSAVLAGAVVLGSLSTQSGWSDGPGTPGPVMSWGSAFHEGETVAWMSVAGQLALSSVALDDPVRHDLSLSFGGCYSACIGDVNGDGLNDLAATAFNADELRLWLADGQGGWSDCTVAEQDGALACSFADIDGDGDADILFTTYSPGSVRIYLNQGGSVPEWQEQVLTTTVNGAHDIEAADIDQDGDLDVVAAIAEDDLILWWRNDGGSPVQWVQQTVGTAGYPCRFDVADLNGDGNTDIAAAGYESDAVKVWYGSGGPAPSWTSQLACSGVVGAHGVGVCDIDGDGDLDMFVAALDGNEIFWLRNDGGSPAVWTPRDIDTFAGCGCAEPSDIDGDGDYDVSCGSFGSAGTAWWENLGDGTAWDQHILGSGMGTFSMVRPGDVDMDGDLDIVCCGFSGNRLCWFEATSFLASGWLESSILDTGCEPQYASIDWEADLPPGTSMEVQYRSSDTPASMGSWSPGYSSPTELSGLVKRFFQYRINLGTAEPPVSPLLYEFRFGYDPVGIEVVDAGGLTMEIAGGNPCSGGIAVELCHPEGGTFTVQVFDLSGRVVAHSTEESAGGDPVWFSAPELPPGVYRIAAQHSSGDSVGSFQVVL
jgi:hypothetical protein